MTTENQTPNCPLVTGLRPCQCDLPRCPKCGYTKHDAQFEGDHHVCGGLIPEPGPLANDRPDRHGDGSDASDYEPEPAVRMPDDEPKNA